MFIGLVPFLPLMKKDLQRISDFQRAKPTRYWPGAITGAGDVAKVTKLALDSIGGRPFGCQYSSQRMLSGRS
jgi:hypothetical protein